MGISGREKHHLPRRRRAHLEVLRSPAPNGRLRSLDDVAPSPWPAAAGRRAWAAAGGAGRAATLGTPAGTLLCAAAASRTRRSGGWERPGAARPGAGGSTGAATGGVSGALGAGFASPRATGKRHRSGRVGASAAGGVRRCRDATAGGGSGGARAARLAGGSGLRTSTGAGGRFRDDGSLGRRARPSRVLRRCPPSPAALRRCGRLGGSTFGPFSP